jgi:hypothetical protein
MQDEGSLSAASVTCPHAHGRWAALINSAPDAQLAAVVGSPAPWAAAPPNGARVMFSRSYGDDRDACRGEEGCTELLAWMAEKKVRWGQEGQKNCLAIDGYKGDSRADSMLHSRSALGIRPM